MEEYDRLDLGQGSGEGKRRTRIMLRFCNLVTLQSLYLPIFVVHFFHSLVATKWNFYNLNKPEM